MDPNLAQVEGIIQALATAIGDPYSRYAGGMSQASPFGGTMWDTHVLDSMYPEKSIFVNPLIDTAAKMLFPSLVVPGLDGTPTFALNTNFTRTRAPGSTASQAIARRNAEASRIPMAAYDRSQRDTWNKSWGDNGGVMKLLDALGVDNLSPVRALAWNLNTNNGGDFASMIRTSVQPMINSWLGYDRGTEFTVAQQRSMELAAASNARDGTIRYYDPYSKEFQTMRSAAQTLVGRGADKMLYDEDGIKKASMRGASSLLISNVIANALASGKADEYLKNEKVSDDAKTLIEELGLGGNDIGDNWSQASLERVLGGAQNKQMELENQLVQDRNSLEAERGRGEEADRERIEKLEAEIKQKEEALKKATDLGDRASDALVNALEPLGKSIAAATDSLKDLYGSENEAVAALQRITGDKSLTDANAADLAKSQVNRLAVLSQLSGLDPSEAGKVLDAVTGSLGGVSGSKLAKGSAYQGQMGMAFTEQMLRGAAEIGGAVSPEEKQKMMDAYAKATADYDSSPHRRMAIMAMMQRDELGEERYGQIVNLMNSGNSGDFQKAKKIMSQFMGGEDIFNRIFNDQGFLSNVASKFSMEDAKKLGEYAVTARNNELMIEGSKANAKADVTAIGGQLLSAGFTGSEVRGIAETADFDALYYYTKDNEEGGGREAHDMLTRLQEAAKAEHPDWSEDQIKREAVRRFHRAGGMDLFDEKTRSKVEEAMQGQEAFDLKNTELFMHNGGIMDENTALGVLEGGLFSSVGATDKERRLSRTAFGQVNKNLLDTIRKQQGVLRDSNGQALDIDTVQENFKRWNEAYKSGDIDRISEAQKEMEAFYGSLDESSRGMLSRAMSGNSYRTLEDIKRDSTVQKALSSEYLGETMGNLDRDTQIKYAEWLDETRKGEDFNDEEFNKAVQAREAILNGEGVEDQYSDLERVIRAVKQGKVTTKEELDALRPKNMSKEQWAAAQEFFVKQLGAAIGIDIDETPAKEEGPKGRELLTAANTHALLNDEERLIDFQSHNTLGSGTLARLTDDEIARYASLQSGEVMTNDRHRVKRLRKIRDDLKSGNAQKVRRARLDLNALETQLTQDQFDKLERERDEKLAAAGGETTEEGKAILKEYNEKLQALDTKREDLRTQKEGLEKVTDKDLLLEQRALEEKSRAEDKTWSEPNAGAGAKGPSEVSLSGPVTVEEMKDAVKLLSDINNTLMALSNRKSPSPEEDRTA